MSYDNCISDLDKLEQTSVVPVNGRLRENITLWRSIGASQWLLNELCEGLPFVVLPVNKYFSNHKSASCHAEFVSAEISKLLASGAIVEVLSADRRVCNPLGVAVNGSGKPRLILDLRYVGPYLFTKVHRTLTKHWRSKGIRMFSYLDDGAGADSSF